MAIYASTAIWKAADSNTLDCKIGPLSISEITEGRY